MAGKLTILRQAAIICILAQNGFDGAGKERGDRPLRQSFSAAWALRQSGPGAKHLHGRNDGNRPHPAPGNAPQPYVILDEIGRGTSTYDGVALAGLLWKISLAVPRVSCARFATHYHELTALENCLDGIFTMNIAIRESNGEILFLHKIIPGPADKSYGVEVARLAGVPYPVVQRARVILQNLEKRQERRQGA